MPSHSLSSFTLTCSKCSHKKIYDYDYLNNLMENDESLDFSNFNKIVPRIKCRKCKKKNFIIEDENDNLIFDTDHGVNCRECNLLIPFTRLYAVPGTQVCTSCKEIENDSEGLVFPLVPNGFNKECPRCKDRLNGIVVVYRTNDGIFFLGCSKYPNCHWSTDEFNEQLNG